jgi:TonB family protein
MRQITAPTRPATTTDAPEDTDPKLGSVSSSNRDRFPGGNGIGDIVGLLRGEPNGSLPPVPPREPTPTPTARKPITVSQGVQLALLTHRVEPIYPNFARQAHREGTVELRATISSDGAVRDVQVLSGDPVLARAAQEAVAHWRFRPTLLNGIAVEVISFFTVNFHIEP